MTNDPTTIALIPCFNGEEFLRASVVSLINQSRPPDQIYVIDDGSSDSSKSIIASLETIHPLVTGVFFDHNRGKAACLNECFANASATYFVLQDADDVARPNRIERQITFMEAHPDVACSSCNVRYINERDRIIAKGQLDLVTENRVKQYLASDEPFGLFCPAVVLRASILKDPSLRFRSQFWPADDIDLWNRIAEAGHLVLAQPEYLVDYRIHGRSAVTSSFFRTREKFEFVRACLRARRMSLPEPNWQEFKALRQARPWLIKLNDWRKTSAKGFYRNAGFRWGEGRKGTAFASLLAATCLQPGYVLPRLRKQFL